MGGRSHPRLAASLAAAAFAAAAAAAPATADWLVMRDGSRVESRGAWEVRGALVVLTLPNGALSSVRAKDVDFDASKAATEEAARPPAAAAATPVPPKKPAVVLTDANVGHVDDVPAPTTAPPAGSPAAAAAKPAAPAERLVIGEWHQDLDASKGGATLVGQVTNVSADLVQDVRVKVSLLDEKGELLADANALIGAATLLPGQGTNFRVTFLGVFHYASTKFVPEGYARKVAAPPPPGT